MATNGNLGNEDLEARLQNIMKVCPYHKGMFVSSRDLGWQKEDRQLIMDECNTLFMELDNKISIIHNVIKDNYRLKFPELDFLVPNPIDYVRVVKKIGNETDLTLVDLQDLLPPATVLVICVTNATTTGEPLPQEIMQRTLDGCDKVLALDELKRKILNFKADLQ